MYAAIFHEPGKEYLYWEDEKWSWNIYMK